MKDKDSYTIYENLQLRDWLIEQGFNYEQANQIIEEGMLKDAGEWLAKRFAIPLVVATSILGNLGCTDNTCPAEAMQQAAAEAETYTQSATPGDALTPDNQDKVDALEDPALKDKWKVKFKAQQEQQAKDTLADEIRELLDKREDKLGPNGYRMVTREFEEDLPGMSVQQLQQYKSQLSGG